MWETRSICTSAILILGKLLTSCASLENRMAISFVLLALIAMILFSPVSLSKRCVHVYRLDAGELRFLYLKRGVQTPPPPSNRANHQISLTQITNHKKKRGIVLSPKY